MNINGSLIFGEDKIAVDVDRIVLSDIKYNQMDIDSGKVFPDAWAVYQPALLRWLTSALDGILFSKPEEIGQFGIKLVMSGTVQSKFMEISVVLS